MKNRKTSTFLATTSVAALSMFAMAGSTSTPSLALCVIENGSGGTAGAGYVGNGNDNEVICTDIGGLSFPESVIGLGGNDTLTINGDTVGAVSGGNGNDSLSMESGAAINVQGDDGNDLIEMSGGGVVVDVEGGDGNDLIEMSGGTVGDEVRGGFGDDTISVSGGYVSSDVQGDGGNDTITVSGGIVADDVQGDEGNDQITISGSAEIGDNVEGEEGDDTIYIQGGEILGTVFGDEDEHEYEGGDDLIEMSGGSVGEDIEGGEGDDTITVSGGFVDDDVEGNDGNDQITVSGSAEIGDDVEGDRGNDAITVAENAAIGGNVEGQQDDDTIFIQGGEIQGSVFGDGDEDDSDVDDGNDLIEMSGGSVGDDVEGGGGDDTITVSGGFVTDDVEGNEGNDRITVSVDAEIGDDVEGDVGNDTITIAGNAKIGGNVEGQQDDDTIFIQGGEIQGSVYGDGDPEDSDVGDGNDLIEMSGGSVGNDIEGGKGDDTIVVSGGYVTDDVEGEDGNDRITVSGSAEIGDDVEGDRGNDTITIAENAAIGGNVEGQQDDDTIYIQGGEIQGSVFGDGDAEDSDIGDGDDLIELSGGSVGNDIEGGGGDDTINLLGPLTLGGNIRGGVGDDALTVFSGADPSNADNADGGEGQDLLTLDMVSGTITGVTSWENLVVRNGSSATVNDATGIDDVLVDSSALTLNNSPVANDVVGTDNDEAVTFGPGTVVGGDVLAFGGEDTLTLAGGEIIGLTSGGDGDDVIDLLSGTAGIVEGGEGEDTLTLDGATVEAIVGDVASDGPLGMSNNDTILLYSGNVLSDVWGQGGDDLIVQDGADIANDIQAGVGNDVVWLFTGPIGGDVYGSGDDDTVVVFDDFDFDDLGAGAGNIFGDDGLGNTGDDTLIFDDWTGSVNADRLQEFNVVNLNSYTEATFTGGDLESDGGGDIEMFIDETSTLLLTNNLPDGSNTTIVGNVYNGNLIDLSTADTDPDNILTVTGNYTASSDLAIDTFLNDGVLDITDQLIVGGDTSGTTNVFVTNTGGPGGLTGDGPTDGILVVSVGGESDGDFVLANDVIAGIFEYDLNQADGQNWYLQSDWLDQVYVYEALPGAMQTIGLALTGQLVERVGVRSATQSPLLGADGAPVAGGAPVDSAIWGRAVGLSLDSEGDLESTTGGNFNQTIGFLQAGVDVAVLRRDSGRLLVGALGHWGTSSVDVNGADNAARGSADFDFYGGGLTATWYGNSGLYFDNVFQYTVYDVDISTATRFSNVSTDGWGFSASHEVGYRVPISETVAIVPQAQITYQTFDFDDFTDPDGVRVSYGGDDSLVGRLGVAVENNAAIGSSLVTGYLEANVLHEFLGDNTVNTFNDVGGTIPFSQDLGGTSVEVGLGGTIAVSRGVSLYAEVDYTIPLDNGLQGFQALGGIRVNLNPAPPPPPPVVIDVIPTSSFIVFFDWDRADLTPEANLVLDDVAVVANEDGYASVRLDGYTDLSGSAQYNLGLSERRANSVADGLIARGIAPDEIVIRAFGEENPLVPTPDGVREPQNRRVEILLS